MADIQQYLDQIAKAEAGEDVRWSIHDSIKKINQEVVETTRIANESRTAAQESAESAESSMRAANTAKNAVENITWSATTLTGIINRGNFIRGKNLTGMQSYIIRELRKNEVGDLFVGDYMIGATTRTIYRIAHINYGKYILNCSECYEDFDIDNPEPDDKKMKIFGRNNIVIFPDSPLMEGTLYSNTTDTVGTRGYIGSKMVADATVWKGLIRIFMEDIGIRPSSTMFYAPSGVDSNGFITGVASVNDRAILPSEMCVYGCRALSKIKHTVICPTFAEQFSLFKSGPGIGYDMNYTGEQKIFWLMDPNNQDSFCIACSGFNNVLATYGNAKSINAGYRPFFILAI